jgi:cytoskeletal protein CcmA (bactofilin family)
MIGNKKKLFLFFPFLLSSCYFYGNNSNLTKTEPEMSVSSNSLVSKPAGNLDPNKLVSKPAGNLDPNKLVSKPAGNLDPKKFVIVKNNGYANITLDEKGGYELHIVFSLTDFNIKSSNLIDSSESIEIKVNIDGVEKIFSVEKELFKNQKSFSIFVNGVTEYSDIKVNIALKDNKGNSVLEKEFIENKVSENKSVSLKLSKPMPKTIVESNTEGSSSTSNSSQISSNSSSSNNGLSNANTTANASPTSTPSDSISLSPTPSPISTPIIDQTPIPSNIEITSNYQFDKAIISNKDINMIGSPYIYSESTNTGDVHSNSDINLSGYIDGNITYFGDMTKSSNITISGQTTQSNKIILPTFDTTKPSTSSSISPIDVFEIPLVNNQIIVKDQTINSSFSVKNNFFKGGGIKDIVLDNVVIDGDFDISGSNNIKVIIKNKLYIKGAFSIGGSASIESDTNISLLISDGDINISGSSSSLNTIKKIVFIGKSVSDTSIQIKDASKFYGIFYTENISSNIIITGSAEIYGSIISNGSIEINSAPKVMRLLNLQSVKNISD